MASYKISISLRSIQDTITWLSKKWFVSNVNVLDFVGEIGGTIKKTDGYGALFDVEMSKKCTLLWREARFEVKMLKHYRG